MVVRLRRRSASDRRVGGGYGRDEMVELGEGGGGEVAAAAAVGGGGEVMVAAAMGMAAVAVAVAVVVVRFCVRLGPDFLAFLVKGFAFVVVAVVVVGRGVSSRKRRGLLAS